MAEVDDHLQNRPAGLHAEAIGIKLAALSQPGSPLACMQFAEVSFTTSGRERDSSCLTTSM